MLRRLLACTRAASTVETAIVMPGLLLLFMAFIEVSMLLWVNMAMESALRVSSRFGLTGWAPVGTDRRTVILQMIQDRTLGMVTADSATITTLVYGDFSQIGMPEPYSDIAPANGRYDPGEPFVDVNGDGVWSPDMGKVGQGGPGDVVLYTITYKSSWLTPIQAFVGGSGFTTLKASAVVRNEPWGS